MEKEIWKPIEGYERIYAISSCGNVRSFHDGMNLLIPRRKKSGYLFVCLSKNNIQRYFHIHRLVGKAFIPNPDKKPQINHKNGIKDDNRVENLEWNTHAENQRHSWLINPNRKVVMPRWRIIHTVQKSELGIPLFYWESMTAAAKHYKVSTSTINKGYREKKLAIGFRWEAVSKEVYESNKVHYTKPPLPVIANVHKRDLTKAHEGKRIKNDSYTTDFFIEHGIKCLKYHGTLHRNSFESYAKKHSIPSYSFIVKRFEDYDAFKDAVYIKLARAYQL